MIIRLFTLISVFSLVACTRQAPVPSDNFHRLPEFVTDSCPSPSLSDDTILVSRLRADGLHTERAMLYIDVGDELTLKQYHYNYWVDSPPSMIQSSMVDFLRKASAAPLIVSDHDIDAVLIISGRIKRFECAFSKQGSVVHVTLELRVDEKDTDRPLLVEDYSESIATSSTAMEDEIRAYQEGLERIFCRIQNDTLSALQANP